MRIDESLRVVLDGLNESVYFLDTHGKVIFTNSMFTERLVKARSEVENRSVYDVVPAEVVEQRRRCIEEVIATAKATTYEEERFCDVFLNSVSPILDEKGRVGNIAFVGTNITEQRRLLESLASVVQRLEAFAQGLSHDIKGPLTTALAAAETLRSSSSSSQASQELLDEVIVMLLRSINKAFSLVDNLLVLSEIDSERITAEATDVSEVVAEVIEEKQAQILERGTCVEVSDDLGSVKADRTHLYQLFSNVIGNSLEYNTAATPTIYVEFLGEKEGGLQAYRVRDNGGLPVELIDRIFDPFVKGPGGKSGLGLAIVHRIVTTYHGYVLAYDDHGAVFEFALKDV